MPHDPWQVLQLEPTRELGAIKRAYARLLKLNRPEDDGDGFQLLNWAYRCALRAAQSDSRERPHHDWSIGERAESPLDEASEAPIVPIHAMRPQTLVPDRDLPAPAGDGRGPAAIVDELLARAVAEAPSQLNQRLDQCRELDDFVARDAAELELLQRLAAATPIAPANLLALANRFEWRAIDAYARVAAMDHRAPGWLAALQPRFWEADLAHAIAAPAPGRPDAAHAESAYWLPLLARRPSRWRAYLLALRSSQPVRAAVRAIDRYTVQHGLDATDHVFGIDGVRLWKRLHVESAPNFDQLGLMLLRLIAASLGLLGATALLTFAMSDIPGTVWRNVGGFGASACALLSAGAIILFTHRWYVGVASPWGRQALMLAWQRYPRLHDQRRSVPLALALIVLLANSPFWLPTWPLVIPLAAVMLVLSNITWTVTTALVACGCGAILVGGKIIPERNAAAVAAALVLMTHLLVVRRLRQRMARDPQYHTNPDHMLYLGFGILMVLSFAAAFINLMITTH